MINSKQDRPGKLRHENSNWKFKDKHYINEWLDKKYIDTIFFKTYTPSISYNI
jgi:hypothetical protein